MRATPIASEPSLSLVIPAYNEADRIGATIAAVLAFFETQPYATELIVVDDGSSDDTAQAAREQIASHRCARLVSIQHGGKAAALRAGMRSAQHAQIAFCDADLATPLSDLTTLRARVAEGCQVAIGSREGMGARRLGEPIYRHVMGRVFNAVVRLLLLPGIHDTQCGFKLFERAAARVILNRARLYANADEAISGPRVTAFDVELLVIAHRLGYKICTVPVVWSYGSHSKVHPARDTWHNVRDVLTVRFNAWRGYYQ